MVLFCFSFKIPLSNKWLHLWVRKVISQFPITQGRVRKTFAVSIFERSSTNYISVVDVFHFHRTRHFLSLHCVFPRKVSWPHTHLVGLRPVPVQPIITTRLSCPDNFPFIPSCYKVVLKLCFPISVLPWCTKWATCQMPERNMVSSQRPPPHTPNKKP